MSVLTGQYVYLQQEGDACCQKGGKDNRHPAWNPLYVHPIFLKQAAFSLDYILNMVKVSTIRAVLKIVYAGVSGIAIVS